MAEYVGALQAKSDEVMMRITVHFDDTGEDAGVDMLVRRKDVASPSFYEHYLVPALWQLFPDEMAAAKRRG